MKVTLEEILVCKEIGHDQKEVRNFKTVKLGSIVLYFSYDNLVGFCTPNTGLCVTENVWGTSVGRHLNMISNEEDRLPREDFKRLLDSIVLNIDILGGI